MKTSTPRAWLAATILALTLPLLPTSASSQPYPSKPIRVIIPFSAGGGTDIVARVIMEKVAQSLGTTAVPENRPGAGATTGTNVVAKAAPDGYTVGIITSSHAINPWIYKTVPFDSVNDFAVISMICAAPAVLVVNQASPIKTVTDLIALAKKEQLTYATAGFGTPPHLAAEWFNAKAGVKMRHVPYPGNNEVFMSLIGGQVPVSFPTLAATLSQIRSGALRAVAVATSKRTSFLPNVPTIAESGLPGYDISPTWFALVAPANTPSEIVATLQREVVKALQLDDVKKRLETESLEPIGSSTAEATSMLKEEIVKWGELAKTAGVEPQ